MQSELARARTALFTPATRNDRFEKAFSGPADAVILDLEDAVAAGDKDRARRNVVERMGWAQGPRFSVRINPLSTSEGRADLVAIAAAAEHTADSLLEAVVLPKAELVEDILELATALPESVELVALIESGAGVLNAPHLARTPGVARLGLGGLDLALDLHCAPDSATMASARAQLVFASRAAGIAGPIDTPSAEFRDHLVVLADAGRAKADGFTGKLCIHPAQIELVHQVLAPTPEELAWARSVLAVGEGVGTVNGQMVDRPVLDRARRLLDHAGVV